MLFVIKKPYTGLKLALLKVKNTKLSLKGRKKEAILDVRTIKSFFQLLKTDASKQVKLCFIKNLKRLMNHIANEKEPLAITSSFWSSYLELINDKDLIIRLNFRYFILCFVVTFLLFDQ